MADLLPEIDVVKDDPFNSDPRDPKNMGPNALMAWRRGDTLAIQRIRTPLVSLLGPVGAWCRGQM